MIRAFAVLPIVLMGLGRSVAAPDPRERLIELATIEVSHDLCHFDLSEAQDFAITAERQRLVDDGAVSGNDITDIQDGVLAAMTRQVPEGLCKPAGAGERLYRHYLGSLSAP